MTEKTYTGAALEQALKDNSLARPGIVLIGMVKPGEKPGTIRFTRSGCENWVDLPVDLIECAEHVGQSPCKDHSHPIMKITLKEPKDPAAQVYAALLAQPASAHAGPMHEGHFAPPRHGMHGGPPMSFRGDGGGGGPHGGMRPRSRRSERIRGGLGQFPGGGGGGGLNAWGCWDSCCGSRCAAGHYEAGPAGWQWVCDYWICTDPCEKCIWPW